MVLETDFLRTDVPAKTKEFLRSSLNYARERKTLTSVIEIQNENWG